MRNKNDNSNHSGEALPDAIAEERSGASIARAFNALVDVAQLKAAGLARPDPRRLLLARGYTPKHRIGLFGHRFYLTNLLRDVDFRFFVAYVELHQQHGLAPGRRVIHARIFYKDSSLIWRSASHFIDSHNEQWIGKGDLKPEWIDGEERMSSAEETTNLPYELQAALDTVSRRTARARADRRAIALVLRHGPDDRIRPYDDFSRPRREAMADPAQRINDSEPVAWFERDDDPTSLVFAPGFAPDFEHGPVAQSESKSRLYGGRVLRLRFVSHNRAIQYLFVAAPRQTWIIPPQTLATALSSYGLRMVDVEADEKLFLPGYEFHYMDSDENPPQLHTQIPSGFAGAPSDLDPSRSDTSPWNDRLPVIDDFRRRFAELI